MFKLIAEAIQNKVSSGRGPDGNPRDLAVDSEGHIYLNTKLFATPYVTIPGITAADALDAGDAMGVMGVFGADVDGNPLPEYGVLLGLELIDLDDDTLAPTIHIYTRPFAPTANDAALAHALADAPNHLVSEPFPTWTDMGTFKKFNVVDMDKPYYSPAQALYWQFSTAGTPTIASTAVMPQVRAHILPMTKPE